MAHRGPWREIDAGRIFVGLVGDHDDRANPFGGELAGQHRHGQAAVDRLTSGHCYGIVEKQLVSDVDLGRDRRPDRQHPRMGVGPVPEIGKDVLGFRERCLADPWGAFTTHLGEGRGGSIHELGEVVATYPGHRAAALGDLSGGIVWAARAEIGRAAERYDIAAELAFLCLQKGEAFGDPRRGMKAGDALRNDPCDLGRGQLTIRRQYPVAVLVELADDTRANVLPPIVELFFKLVLDDGAFFFDYQDFFEPLGEVPDALAFERPGHRDFIKTKADFGGVRIVDPQIVECLPHIQIGFSGGDYSEPRPRAVDDNPVEPVRTSESKGGVELEFMQPIFLFERLIGPADIEPTRRHLEIIGEHNIDTLRTDLDRGRTVDGFGDCFKGDPTSGIPGHRPAIETEVEEFLHPRRVQNRDAGIHKGVFGLMRQCRGFAGVIVAG